MHDQSLTARLILMNATSLIILKICHCPVGSLFVFNTHVTEQCLYIYNIIYLSTESKNEMVLFKPINMFN